ARTITLYLRASAAGRPAAAAGTWPFRLERRRSPPGMRSSPGGSSSSTSETAWHNHSVTHDEAMAEADRQQTRASRREVDRHAAPRRVGRRPYRATADHRDRHGRPAPSDNATRCSAVRATAHHHTVRERRLTLTRG